MKNNSNIYDIDGKLIRAAGDNHQFSMEEVEQMIDYYAAKVQENPENQAYKTYLNNLYGWLNHMYSKMTKEQVIDKLNTLSKSINVAKSAESEQEAEYLDEVNNVINQFKDTIDKEDARNTQFNDISTAEEVVPVAV